MFVCGVMIAGVGITAYVLDCYPTGSGEVSCFMNFARCFGGRHTLSACRRCELDF